MEGSGTGSQAGEGKRAWARSHSHPYPRLVWKEKAEELRKAREKRERSLARRPIEEPPVILISPLPLTSIG